MGKSKQSAILLFLLLLGLAACGSTDVEYFPLNAGKSWQYRITVHDMDVEKKYKQHVVNQPVREIDGVTKFVRKVNDDTLYFYEPTAAGISRTGIERKNDLETVIEEQNFYAIKFPIEVGTSWEQETTTGVLEVVIAPFRRHYALHTPVLMKYTIASLDQNVKVPAGRFNKCIKVVGLGTTKVEAEKTIGIIDVTVESSDWYCPNVGLVKSQRDERTSSTVLVKGDFLMELERFSEG